jgi:hypothetical protein
MVAHLDLKSLIEIIKINMSIQKEIWVDSYYFPEKYEVSNLGNVKNKLNNKFIGIYQKRRNQKYKWVSLCLNKKKIDCSIHRLVYWSFFPNTNQELIIHHIDNNPLNNKLSNLESMKMGDHVRMHNNLSGRRPIPKFGKENSYFKGEIIGVNKLTNIIEYIFVGQKDMLKSPFDYRSVYHSVNGKHPFHKGFFFKRITDNLNIKIGDNFDKFSNKL